MTDRTEVMLPCPRISTRDCDGISRTFSIAKRVPAMFNAPPCGATILPLSAMIASLSLYKVNCPDPPISAVNGPAAGAGANLALSADVVFAAESAYFLQAFTRIGLIPDAGGTYLLPRSMGTAKAMGAALFADKISAKQADDWGMIWEAVDDASFDAHWREKAAQLASGPTAAYAGVKKVLRGSWDNSYEDQLTMEAHEQGVVGKSRDFKEGVLAFTEKRPATFEGR